MNNSEKKKICIIEDNQGDWRSFHDWLSGKYEVFPNDEDSFLLLRENIASLYGKNTLVKESEEARIKIKEKLAPYNADLYIVDYQLIVDNSNGHGIRFSEEFLEEKNILLVTGTEGKKGKAIINKMTGFCNKESAGKKKSFCKEDFDEDAFREAFVEIVNSFFPVNKSFNTDGF